MTPSEYLVASARTAAGSTYPERVCQDAFQASIDDVIYEIEVLDRVKKGLFYNRDVNLDWPDEPSTSIFHDFDMDIVHGILGVATEGSELLELLRDPHRFEMEKLVDEAGDVCWYLAMLFRAADTSFEEVMAKNIAKLMVRFPEKFEEHLANHRDDAKERAVFSA